MVTVLYIVRHCQSEGNARKIFQGRQDLDITDEGKRQLDLLSLRFRNTHIQRVYSSPLKRALATAEAINRFHGLGIEICEELSEVDVGDMQGMPLSDVGKNFPELAKKWNDCPDLCCFPNGEAMKDVYRRASSCVDRLLRENKGKTAVVVTHGGVIRNICAYISYGAPEGIRNSAVFGNTSVSCLETDENGVRGWRFLNDLSHLPEEVRDKSIRYVLSTEGDEKTVI